MSITEFRERIINLRPNNMMGLNGAGPGILGASSSGSDALMQLQRITIEFAHIYQQGDSDQVATIKKEVIAKIMVAHAVDAITEQQADELLESLHQLIEKRRA